MAIIGFEIKITPSIRKWAREQEKRFRGLYDESKDFYKPIKVKKAKKRKRK